MFGVSEVSESKTIRGGTLTVCYKGHGINIVNAGLSLKQVKWCITLYSWKFLGGTVLKERNEGGNGVAMINITKEATSQSCTVVHDMNSCFT